MREISGDDSNVEITSCSDPRLGKASTYTPLHPQSVPFISANSCNEISAEKHFRREQYYRKRRRAPRTILSTQSGDSMFTIAKWQESAKGVREYIPEAYFSMVETLVLTYISIINSSNKAGVAAAIAQAYGRLSNKTLAGQVLSLVDWALDKEPQSAMPSWIESLRDAQHNWTKIMTSHIAVSVSNLLGICVGLGLCEATGLKAELWGMRMFAISARSKQSNAIDLVTAVLETSVFFFEGAYRCMNEKSISPLFSGGDDSDQFDTDFLKCLRCVELMRAGNLTRFENMTNQELDLLLTNSITRGEYLKRVSSTSLKLFYDRKLTILNSCKNDFVVLRDTGGLRIPPFCVGLHGGTAVGKSTMFDVVMKQLLCNNGYPCTDEYIVTLNETDKYMSTYKTHITGVLLDDVGNSKAQFSSVNPTQRIIELMSSQKTYANMAEADLKGKVSIEPAIVVITTNKKDLGANAYSNEPASIARRVNVMMTVTVRPEFAHNDMVDSRKVTAVYGDKPPDTILDIWQIDLEHSYPVPPKAAGGTASIGYGYVKWRGADMHNASFDQALRCLTELSAEWFTERKAHMARNKAMNWTMCTGGCGYTVPLCTCKLGFKPMDPTSPICRPGFYCPACDTNHPKVCAPVAPLEPHGAALNMALLSATNILSTTAKKFLDDTEAHAEANVLHASAASWKWLKSSPYAQWKNWVPHAWLHNPRFRAYWSIWNSVHIEESVTRITDMWWYACTFLIVFGGLTMFWFQSLSHVIAGGALVAAGSCGIDSTKHVRAYASAWVYWLFCDDLRSHTVFPIWKLPGEPWKKPEAWVLRTTKMYFLAALASLFVGVYVYMYYPILSLFSFFFAYLMVAAAAAMIDGLEEMKELEVVYGPKEKSELERLERADVVSDLLKFGAGVVGLYLAVKAFRDFRLASAPQSLLEPKDEKELAERDNLPNQWAKVERTSLPVSSKAVTAIPSQLVKSVTENVKFVTLNGRASNVFFMDSAVAVVPTHLLLALKEGKNEDVDITCVVTKKPKEVLNAVQTIRTSTKHSVRITLDNGQPTDLSLLFINCGNSQNMRDYLPQVYPASGPVSMVYRAVCGNPLVGQFYAESSMAVTSTAGVFPGMNYLSWTDTFPGLCCATLVAESKPPYIAGFHLAGVNDTRQGASGSLTRSMYDRALTQLSTISGVNLPPSLGTLSTTTYDVQFFESEDIHFKSATRFLPSPANVDVFGSVRGRTTPTSGVVPSVITDAVEKVCGVANKWGPPSFKKGFPYQASLQYSANCSSGVEVSLLDSAKADYIEPLKAKIKLPMWQKEVKPLTRMQTVCGIDGKSYIDKMPPNTSVGYPLNKPKSDFLEVYAPSAPDDEAYNFSCPRVLDEMFWQEAEKIKQCARDKVRYYAIFQACLKDEPTPLDKEKVRVFQSAPMALQLLLRKYFLPVARFMSVNNLLSECAVGVNSHGRDWEELVKHMTKFGNDRILAGDYSKYDLRMPGQMVLAAFDVLIELASCCPGYTPEDIELMKFLAHEIASPIMAMNGDLIQLFGSNPSGHNLTVYINSIVNSLWFRCAFFALKKGNKPVKFRDIVALMTYGDDAKASVRKGYSWFNHVSFAEFLRQHDVVFTMPDKTSTPTPYMNDKDADFLKRKNIFLKEIGHHVGALDEESIFKSLHCNIKSSVLTPEQAAAQNIDGALREWFFHGPEVYNSRLAEMNIVAETCNIKHVCRELSVTFDERAARWIETYVPHGPEKTLKGVPPSGSPAG